MNYKIASEEDFPELANMRWDFKMEGEEFITDSYDKEVFIEQCINFFNQGYRDKTWIHWIAKSKDVIISHVSIHIIRKIPKPNRIVDKFGYITNVYSKPQYRGQGIGSNLIDHVKQWAVENDLEILIVWPSTKSAKFYQRKGFNNDNDVMESMIRQ